LDFLKALFPVRNSPHFLFILIVSTFS
jgi:hypothetical protein